MSMESVMWSVGAIGVALNNIAFWTNGGKMPAAGLTKEYPRHKQFGAATRFKYLCDVIPYGLGKMSVGDIFIYAFVLMLLWQLSWKGRAVAVAIVLTIHIAMLFIDGNITITVKRDNQ